MKPPTGWRDARTGRVFGFQSETQCENFMTARVTGQALNFKQFVSVNPL
jgi:hypothetical protein